MLALFTLAEPRHVQRTRQYRLGIEQRQKRVQTVHEHLITSNQWYRIRVRRARESLPLRLVLHRLESRPSLALLSLLLSPLRVEVLDRLQQVVVASLQHQFQHRPFLVGEQLVEHIDGGRADLDRGGFVLGLGVADGVLALCCGGVVGCLWFRGGDLHAVDATRGKVVVRGAGLRGGQVESDRVLGSLLAF